MPILLSHNSALERLRSVPPQVDTARTLDVPLPIRSLSTAPSELRGMDLTSLGIRQLPVHHLVPSTKHQPQGGKARQHRCRLDAIPAGLVREIEPNVYAAGPELCFIQMAQVTSLLGAVVLGHELCGSYSHFAQMVSGFYERPPLTSVERISQAIEQLDGMYGTNRARKALQWVRDGSESPMETVVSCMLNLPTDMGGFGLVAPELNYEVKLDEVGRQITGTRTVRVDSGYPAQRVGLEYDGKDYHRDAVKDRLRREALMHEGWTVFLIDVDEMGDWKKLKNKVDLLGEVGRQHGSGEVEKAKSRTLLSRLLKATRCGVGLNAALFGTHVPKGVVKVHVQG